MCRGRVFWLSQLPERPFRGQGPEGLCPQCVRQSRITKNCFAYKTSNFPAEYHRDHFPVVYRCETDAWVGQGEGTFLKLPGARAIVGKRVSCFPILCSLWDYIWSFLLNCLSDN